MRYGAASTKPRWPASGASAGTRRRQNSKSCWPERSQSILVLRCGIVVDDLADWWFGAMRFSPLNCALYVALALTTSSCVTATKDEAFTADAAKLLRFPACESEIKA